MGKAVEEPRGVIHSVEAVTGGVGGMAVRLLPTAFDPMLQKVNRLRRLLAVLEECEPAEPVQFPTHMYGCGCAYCSGVVGQPPTFDEIMAVIQQKGKG